MNTRVLATGCVVVISVALVSVALVSGQSDQTTREPKPAGKPVARAQSEAPVPKVPSPAGIQDAATERALVDQYCVVCHNAKLKTANLLLDELDLAHLGAHAEIGEKVVRKLRAGMMPPTGMRRRQRRVRSATDPRAGR